MNGWEAEFKEDLSDLNLQLELFERRLQESCSAHAEGGESMAFTLENDLATVRIRAQSVQACEDLSLPVMFEDDLRRLYKGAALLDTMSKWHSATSTLTPPYHDLSPLSVQTAFNDYDRGFVEYEFFYEQHFRRYFESEEPLRRRGLLFSCGMGALQTVLQYELESSLTLAMGQRTYHETQLLVQLQRQNHGLRVIPFDESNRDPGYLRSVIEHADLLLCDTLTMNKDGFQLDLPLLYQAVQAASKPGFKLLLDNTLLGPELFLPAPPPGITVYLFESLIKHYQLGLDLAAAGSLMILGDCDYHTVINNLERLRGTIGTNINPVNLRMLPQVPREMIVRRIQRQRRNAQLLHGLLQHSGNIAAAGNSGLLFVETTEPTVFQDLFSYLAAARGVRVLKGTSFGFNSTRISTMPGDPHCVRISCGMESEPLIRRMAEVAQDVLAAMENEEIVKHLEELNRRWARHQMKKRADEATASEISSSLQELNRLVRERIR